MASTKIINVLKDDSFDEILGIFKETSAKEVIFVLPKKSKAFKEEDDFVTLRDEASKESKTISLLCSNPDINSLARKYNFDVLISEDENKPSRINTVNQFEENEKPRLETKIKEEIKELPPWGNVQLPGLPVGKVELEFKPKSKIKTRTKPEPSLILQTTAEPEIEAEIKLEPELPEYEFMHAVKIKKIEDIISPDKEDSYNIKISPKKEKQSGINIKKYSANQEDEEKALEDIRKVWENQSDKNKEKKSSSIWADWDFNINPGILPKKRRRFSFKIPAFSFNLNKFKKNNYKLKKFNSKKIILALIIASIFILGSLISIAGSVKITIIPHKEQLNSTIKIMASDKYITANTLSGRIPGQLFTVEKQLSRKFNTTGQKDAIQKTRGKITIYNNLNSSQPLIATTRFESETKLIFRTLTTVVVPAARIKNGQTTPGTIDVEVIADKPGPEYNNATGKFMIVAFKEKGDTEKYNNIYAILSSPMHGGINGKSTVVTEADYNSAKEALSNQLSKELNDDIKAQAAQFKIIDSAFSIVFKDPISTANPDDAAQNFDMTISASIKTIGFKESDIEDVINSNVQKNGNFMVLPEKLDISFNKARINPTTGILEFELGVKGDAYIKIDEAKLINDLLGKSDKEIQDYLQNDSDVESAKVIFRPFWIKKMPKEMDNIDFKIVF